MSPVNARTYEKPSQFPTKPFKAVQVLLSTMTRHRWSLTRESHHRCTYLADFPPQAPLIRLFDAYLSISDNPQSTHPQPIISIPLSLAHILIPPHPPIRLPKPLSPHLKEPNPLKHLHSILPHPVPNKHQPPRRLRTRNLKKPQLPKTTQSPLLIRRNRPLLRPRPPYSSPQA